jgi:BolA protein
MNLQAMNEPSAQPGQIELDRWAPAMQQRLQARLQATELEVLDESHQHAGHAGANGRGFGTHFRVRIASPLFTGLSRVAKHRLVYDALQDFIDQGAHALAIELL